MEMKEKLSDEEPSAVTGGAYTAEAQAWLDRSRDTIRVRSYEKRPTYLLNFIFGMAMGNMIEDINPDDVKKFLSGFTDVSVLT